MAACEVVICNELGLHARAAARLVERANKFHATVEVGHADRTVNGKSIMGVLMLAAARGTTLTIETRGDDEEAALAALVELVEDGFGENNPPSTQEDP